MTKKMKKEIKKEKTVRSVNNNIRSSVRKLNPILRGIVGKKVDVAIRDLEFSEKRITRDEIYVADEAFFTGTAAEITPINKLDDRIIGNGKKGPITETLQKQYFDCVAGKLKEYNNWLSYVV